MPRIMIELDEKELTNLNNWAQHFRLTVMETVHYMITDYPKLHGKLVALQKAANRGQLPSGKPSRAKTIRKIIGKRVVQHVDASTHRG